MIRIAEAIAQSSLLIFFLCIPPLVLFLMVSRRYRWSRPENKPAFRTATAAAATVILFNLGVSVLAPPRLQVAAISDGVDTPTLIALALSWLCLWLALGVAILAPRRRYRLATLHRA